MSTEVTTQIRQNSPASSEAIRSKPIEKSSAIASEAKAEARQDLQSDEQNLPSNKEQKALSDVELGNAVKDLSSLVQNLKRDLNFSIDSDSGKTIIKVIESETGELIRQIPREEVVQAAQAIESHSGFLVDATV